MPVDVECPIFGEKLRPAVEQIRVDLAREMLPAAAALTANNHPAPRRRNRPVVRQHCLKSDPRPARAWIVAAELFDQLFLAAAHET